jgi:hypothetical protein
VANHLTQPCPFGDTQCTFAGLWVHGDCRPKSGSPAARAIDVLTSFYAPAGGTPTADQRDHIASMTAALAGAGLLRTERAA